MMISIYDIRNGDKESYSKTIVDADVVLYACMTGDFNPGYIDDDFAEKAGYGKRIVPDILVAGLISTIVGTRLPGPGSRCIRQTLEFINPAYIGDTITASVVVTRRDIDSNRIVLAAQCLNQNLTVIARGQLLVTMPEDEVILLAGLKKTCLVEQRI